MFTPCDIVAIVPYVLQLYTPCMYMNKESEYN